MASERIPLLGRGSTSINSFREKENSYQTFFGDYHVRRRISVCPFLAKGISRVLSRILTGKTYSDIALQPAVVFNANRPDDIFTRYQSNASFESSFALQGPPLTKLEWLVMPTSNGLENRLLPPFSVQANAQVVEDVRLIVHSCADGKPQVMGPSRVSFQPQGPDRPSVATFRDVAIKRAGKYVLEVQGVGQPKLSVLATFPLTVDANLEINRSKPTFWSDEISRMSMF